MYKNSPSSIVPIQTLSCLSQYSALIEFDLSSFEKLLKALPSYLFNPPSPVPIQILFLESTVNAHILLSVNPLFLENLVIFSFSNAFNPLAVAIHITPLLSSVILQILLSDSPEFWPYTVKILPSNLFNPPL